MKRDYKLLFIFISLGILLFNSKLNSVYSEKENNSITILFTHDLHDHYYPFDVNIGGRILSKGGYARLSTAIKKEKKINPNLILVDGGDFSMGTLFQTIYSTHSPALRLMGQLGYDVTTFGNHEFDFRAEGLTHSLNVAKNSGDKLPEIVASNTRFPLDKNGQLTSSLIKLKESMNNYGVKDYTVIHRDGIKIGVFGLMGKELILMLPCQKLYLMMQLLNPRKLWKY